MLQSQRLLGFAAQVRIDLLTHCAVTDCATQPFGSASAVDLIVHHHADTPESALDCQPLRQQGLIAVYEGHVDNRCDIARLLKRDELARASDGSVILAAYDAWGEEAAVRLVGEFAFMVVDTIRQQVVAFQDALGVRRIYFRQEQDVVWVASNLRLLFGRFPRSRSEPDPEVMPEYFTGPMVPWRGCTLLKGLRELGRGATLALNASGLTETRRWAPRPSSDVERLALRDTQAEFRRLLFEAVGHAVRSRAPVLCDLSGGLDSTAICTAAATLSRASGESGLLGWSTEHPAANDGRVQAMVREHLSIESITLPIEHHLPFALLGDSELPDSSYVQCGAINRAMRAVCLTRGITTRLSGHGGDILLQKGAPAPVYLSEWLRRGRFRDWMRGVTAHAAAGTCSVWQLLTECSTGSLDMHAGRHRRHLPEWLTPRFRRRVEDERAAFRRRATVLASRARDRDYQATLWLLPRRGEMLPDERKPMVYRPLVEFLLGVDWSHLTEPGVDRPLLRAAFSDLYPPQLTSEVADSRHAAAVIQGLRNAWPSIQPLMTGHCLADLGVLEPRLWLAAVDRARAGYLGVDAQFMNTTLYLEPWLATNRFWEDTPAPWSVC